ncbi:IS3 family transposase [Escherichia coli]|uniref:IS3 family transposase n=1 Tax=Escherichia coli TaxID=562 RepID=UPI00201FFBAD|nr:IS3 family transposase [Escherichia coli]
MAASLRRQGLRQRPPGSSARSATAHTACLCQKICWSRIFTPVARTRSGQETSRTYVQMKAGCIWQWSLTCGHVAVIGWSMSPRMTAQLACDALQMALWRRKRPRNVIVHTDRGGQYCSADYQAQLKRHNLRGSMSAKGCCYDNACVESFFHSLKVECIHGEHFISREIMRATVFNYIECDYNRWRRHSWCGGLSPEQFENQNLA